MEEVVGFPTTSGNDTCEEEVGFRTKDGRKEEDSMEVGFLRSSGTGGGKVDSMEDVSFVVTTENGGKFMCDR